MCIRCKYVVNVSRFTVCIYECIQWQLYFLSLGIILICNLSISLTLILFRHLSYSVECLSAIVPAGLWATTVFPS